MKMAALTCFWFQPLIQFNIHEFAFGFGGGGGGGDGGLNTKKINKMILISNECTNNQVARNIFVGIKS